MASSFVQWAASAGDTEETRRAAADWYPGRSSRGEDAALHRTLARNRLQQHYESTLFSTWLRQFSSAAGGWTPSIPEVSDDERLVRTEQLIHERYGGFEVERLEPTHRAYSASPQWILVVVRARSDAALFRQAFAMRRSPSDVEDFVWRPVDLIVYPLVSPDVDDDPLLQLGLMCSARSFDKWRTHGEVLASWWLGATSYWQNSVEAQRVSAHYSLPQRRRPTTTGAAFPPELKVVRVFKTPRDSNCYIGDANCLRRQLSDDELRRLEGEPPEAAGGGGGVVTSHAGHHHHRVSPSLQVPPSGDPETFIVGSEWSIEHSIALELRVLFHGDGSAMAPLVVKQLPANSARKVLVGTYAASGRNRDADVAFVDELLGTTLKPLLRSVTRAMVVDYNFTNLSRRTRYVFFLLYVVVEWHPPDVINRTVQSDPVLRAKLLELLAGRGLAHYVPEEHRESERPPVMHLLRSTMRTLWDASLEYMSGAQLTENALSQAPRVFYLSRDSTTLGQRGSSVSLPQGLTREQQRRFEARMYSLLAPTVYPMPFTLLYYSAEELARAGLLTKQKHREQYTALRHSLTQRVSDQGDARFFAPSQYTSLVEALGAHLTRSVVVVGPQTAQQQQVDFKERIYPQLMGPGMRLLATDQARLTPVFQRVFFIMAGGDMLHELYELITTSSKQQRQLEDEPPPVQNTLPMNHQ